MTEHGKFFDYKSLCKTVILFSAFVKDTNCSLFPIAKKDKISLKKENG